VLSDTERRGKYASGPVAMRASVFDDLGGWPDLIEGWGGEDVIMRIALARLYGPQTAAFERVYSLWHPKAPRDREEVNRGLRKNFQAAGDVRAALAELRAPQSRPSTRPTSQCGS
jgi:hypothetical protein